MPRLKILISGAGVAGNALAFWLSKLGHQVTVIERYPSLRLNGLQIDLRGHGIEVMKRMGLEQAFRANAAPELAMEVVDKSGKRWGYFPAQKSGESKKAQSITSDFEIMRRDLCKIMYDCSKDRTKYVFGTSIESFEQKGNDGVVEVQFSDGKSEQFDLVVGADGQSSRTRRMMVGEGASDGFKSSNEATAYFTVPQPMKEGEGYNSTMYVATAGREILTRRHDPDTLQVYMAGKQVAKRLKDVKKGDVKAEKETFASVFRGAGWRADEIVDLMLNKTDDFYCERQGVVKLESWSKGHVTLAGDAGYCPSADIGMGTTCAMVGAYVLAGEISEHCGGRISSEGADSRPSEKDGLTTALKAYEEKFRPFVANLQKGIGEPSVFDKIEIGPVLLAIMHRALWVASKVRADLIAGWFLAQKVGGWKLPDYEEMVKA